MSAERKLERRRARMPQLWGWDAETIEAMPYVKTEFNEAPWRIATFGGDRVRTRAELAAQFIAQNSIFGTLGRPMKSGPSDNILIDLLKARTALLRPGEDIKFVAPKKYPFRLGVRRLTVAEPLPPDKPLRRAQLGESAWTFLGGGDAILGMHQLDELEQLIEETEHVYQNSVSEGVGAR